MKSMNTPLYDIVASKKNTSSFNEGDGHVSSKVFPYCSVGLLMKKILLLSLVLLLAITNGFSQNLQYNIKFLGWNTEAIDASRSPDYPYFGTIGTMDTFIDTEFGDTTIVDLLEYRTFKREDHLSEPLVHGTNWVFEPVQGTGDDEPGWYYIRGTRLPPRLTDDDDDRVPETVYLFLSTTDNSVSIGNLSKLSDNYDTMQKAQWRVIKTKSSDLDSSSWGLANRYQAALDGERQIKTFLLRTGSGAAGSPLHERIHSESAVEANIDFQQAEDHYIFNEDQEVVTYSIVHPLSYYYGNPRLSYPEPNDSSTLLTTNNIDFEVNYPTLPAYRSSLNVPMGYAYSQATGNGKEGMVRLIHDNYSAGGNPGDGYYFSRLSPQASLTTLLHKAVPDGEKEYTISFWLRATGEPDSTSNAIFDPNGNIFATVGKVTVGDGPGAVSIPITVPAGGPHGNFLGTLESHRNDGDTHWYLFTGTVSLNGTLKGTPVVIKSTMRIDDNYFATLDIDNININEFKLDNFSFINHENNAHADASQNTPGGLNTPGGNNHPQYVHSRKQIVYLRPNDILPLTAATEGMTYYRWYEANPQNIRCTDGRYNAAILPLKLQTGTQPNFGTQNNGLFYYSNQGFLGRTGQQINVTVPFDFNAPYYVTCDVSNYTDWEFVPYDDVNGELEADSATFYEPTLSFRNHFELHPAWEIAEEIDTELNKNDGADNDHAYEVIRLTAPVGGDDANSFTHLRLSTKFEAQNYYTYSTSDVVDVSGTDLSGLKNDLTHGGQLIWVRSTASDVAGNTLLAGVDTLNHPVIGSAMNNADAYSFPDPATVTLSNADHHIIEIVTGNKEAGDTEYYDVYISGTNGGTTYTRKVARFIVTYVDRDQASDELPFGSGPRVVARDITDDLDNKIEFHTHHFDLPDDADNLKYSMGKIPLPLDDTSYGFDDPEHFGNLSGMLSNGTFSGGTYHANLSGYYNHYSFPQAVRANITGSASGAMVEPPGRNPLSWNTAANIHDRTYIESNGATSGTMLYVNATAHQDTIVSLKIAAGACSNEADMYLSAWVVNLSASSGTLANELPNYSAFRPNLIFVVKGQNTAAGVWEEIARFYTGDIGRGSDVNQWHEIAFKFNAPDEVPGDLIVEVINNGLGNPGNDFALDELKIYRSDPSIIVVRSGTTFCPPSNGVADVDLTVKVDIDLTILASSYGDVPITDLYYRVKNAAGVPLSSPFFAYNNAATYDDVYYGSWNIASVGTTVSENTPYKYADGDTHDHLVFFQEIPPEIYQDEGGLGEYTILANILPENLEDICSGVCVFPVKYDETTFEVRIEGVNHPQNPLELDVCTNRGVKIIPHTKYGKDKTLLLSTYYDWYFGPITTYDTEDLDEQEAIAYEQTLSNSYYNITGIYDRKIFGTDNEPTTNNTGSFSVAEDLKAYRYYYPYATEPTITGIGAYKPTLWPLNDESQTDSEDKADITDVSRFSGAAEEPFQYVKDLDSLLVRMDYYVSNHILSLHQLTYPVAFLSTAPYFYTVLPLSPSAVVDEAGEPTGESIEICQTLTDVRLQAGNWSPEVEFGEVKADGTPLLRYREIESDDYIYTVRLPERLANGNRPNRFVAPLLYIDETHLAKVELIKVDDQFINEAGTSYDPNDDDLDAIIGRKIVNTHIGVIKNNTTDRNILDQGHTIVRTLYGEEKYPLHDPMEMETYWDLDYVDLADYHLEAYPLIYSAYHYYNPDLTGSHDIEKEGDPYPINNYTVNFTFEGSGEGSESHSVEHTVSVANNKIALEIPAAGIPADFLQNGSFKPGSEYLFRLVCSPSKQWSDYGRSTGCDQGFYFRLKVVPDTVYWKNSAADADWNRDTNWETTGITPLAPLRETHVVLDSLLSVYPVLADTTGNPIKTYDFTEQAIDLSSNKTPFIEFDYNFVPNSATEIYFRSGAELGNPFYLNYDSAKVDLKLNAMQWYGLSAPLRQMYSGDYSFERINPLAQMRLFNAVNPQTGTPTLEWTTPFTATTVSLAAGTGFGYNIGRVVFDLEEGQPAGESHHQIADTTLHFPGNKTVFQYYNESTKMPVVGKKDQIGTGGRIHSKRFIYETDGHTVPDGNLLAIPTKTNEENKLIVVGNPFMSHLDFAEFYEENQDIIKPQYKLLKTDAKFAFGEFPSFVLGENEGLDVSSSADPALTRISIPPMQAFIVETKVGYKETTAAAHPNLVITKEMSVVDNAHSALRSAGQEQGILRIKATRDGMDTHAVVALSDQAHNEYAPDEDSRRILSSQLVNSPSIFTITDGKYLDINQMREIPESLPLGISTTGKGITQITITGGRSLSAEYDYYFFDKRTKKKIPFSENVSYEFNNTEGDQIGRFYILRESQSSGLNELQGKMQIYTDRGAVHVLSSDGTEIDLLKIYGPDGSVLYQQTNTKRSHIEIPVTSSNIVLIVTATAGGTTKTQKVIITN